MKQTRRGSFTEAFINVAVGYTINMVANFAIFPLFGWHITLRQNLAMGALYTAISIARGYLIRRGFNAWLHRPRELAP
jgi:hypothetical protein